MESDRDPVPFRAYQPGTQPPYDAPTYGSTHKRHPLENLVALPHTITETTGPQFSPNHFPPIPDLSVVDGKSALGERIIVHGRITAGSPTKAAAPYRGRLSRSGRRTPPVVISIRVTSTMRHSTPISAAKAASTPTRTGSTVSRR